METLHNSVHNYIQQVLLSQDTRTAEQLLTDLFLDCIITLKHEPHNIQLIATAYTIIQAYCKLGLPWQQQFTDFITQAKLPRPTLEELCCKPTKESLRKLILWNTCHKNLLQPNKEELVALVHEIIKSTSVVDHCYTFIDGIHHYRLYHIHPYWYWENIHKQLTWKLKK